MLVLSLFREVADAYNCAKQALDILPDDKVIDMIYQRLLKKTKDAKMSNKEMYRKMLLSEESLYSDKEDVSETWLERLWSSGVKALTWIRAFFSPHRKTE